MQGIDAFSWLILRVVYAWLYLYALKSLLSDWQATENLVALVFPFFTRFFAVVMVFVMIISAGSILIGFYAEIAGFLLFIYNIIGAVTHYKLAKLSTSYELSANASEEDKKILNSAVNLGVVGNVTSAQKNFVLAAVAIFFMILGSGPLSITLPLWH